MLIHFTLSYDIPFYENASMHPPDAVEFFSIVT